MKARVLFTFFFSPVFFLLIHAQPVITWQKSLGGSDQEDISRIIPCNDKGFLILGSTISNDGQVSGNHGNYDYWVVKIDSAGSLVWQKCYGGSANEWLSDGLKTSDGGYILAGSSFSVDGQVSGNHGGFDYWIVKIDSSGNIQWQKCFGGSMDEWAYSIKQTPDSGFVVAGNSQSNDSLVSGNHGGKDFWVIKLDLSGNLQWQQSLGGSGDETAYDISLTNDNGFIVAGVTASNDGQVSGNHGGKDFWVVKLTDGTLSGQKCFGRSLDEEARSIVQTFDYGYTVAGKCSSSDGQV